MLHLRTDSYVENSKRQFACGIGPALPEGDKYVFQSEVGLHHMVDCPECKGSCCKRLGTPISELSGRPGHRGFEKFRAIAASWGYD